MSQTHRDHFNAIASTWCGAATAPEDLMTPLRSFGIQPGDRVLDLGSGKGILAPLLRQLAGPHGIIAAVDLAEQMLLGGRALYDENRIIPLCANVLALPCPANFFDKVVCFSTFPHFKSPGLALREIHRVLRPGGELLIWHLCGSTQLNEFHARLSGIVATDHLPSSQRLARTLEKNGYEVLQCRENPALYWVEAKRSTPFREPVI